MGEHFLKKYLYWVKIGFIVGITIELFCLFLADNLGLYELREFGDVLIGPGLIFFPLFLALLGSAAGYAFETKFYRVKGAITGFFIMFFIFIINILITPKSGDQWGYAFYGFILLLLIPIAIIVGAVIGYLIDKSNLKKSLKK